MARRKNLKKGDYVISNKTGVEYIVAKDQYLYRGKPVVDVGHDGPHQRIAVSDLDPLPESLRPTIVVTNKDVNQAAAVVTDIGEAFLSNKSNEYTRVMGKYDRLFINKHGETFIGDVYDVIDAFGITDGAQQHALKKLLAPGQRGNKDAEQDLNEVIQSTSRALDRLAHKHLRN